MRKERNLSRYAQRQMDINARLEAYQHQSKAKPSENNIIEVVKSSPRADTLQPSTEVEERYVGQVTPSDLMSELT